MMYHKFCVVALTGLLSGCALFDRPVEDEGQTLGPCPTVAIHPEHQKIIQNDEHGPVFTLEIIGYDGYCYYDENTLKDKAVAAPRIKVVRLNDSMIEDIHVSYYIQTYEGPANYLGRKNFFSEIRMPRGVPEIYYTPAQGELSIPAGKYNPDIYMGLNADTADFQYEVK